MGPRGFQLGFVVASPDVQTSVLPPRHAISTVSEGDIRRAAPQLNMIKKTCPIVLQTDENLPPAHVILPSLPPIWSCQGICVTQCNRGSSAWKREDTSTSGSAMDFRQSP